MRICRHCGDAGYDNKFMCRRCEKIVSRYLYYNKVLGTSPKPETEQDRQEWIARYERKFEQWLKRGWTPPAYYMRKKGLA